MGLTDQAPRDHCTPATAAAPLATAARAAPHGAGARRWLWAALLLALALSLRFYRLGASSLWIDEGASLRDARELTANAAYRPLYYLVLRLWSPLGAGEAWLRAPSALCSAGSVLLLYLLARRVAGTRPAVLAALLMALSVQELDHAQEVRMYAMATFLSLASVLALLCWHGRRGLSSLAAYHAFTLLGVATSPSTLLLVVPAAGYAAWHLRHDRRALACLSGGWAAVGLALVPLAVAASRGLALFASIRDSSLRPHLAELAYLPAKLLVSPIGFLAHAGSMMALFRGVGVCCLALLALAAFGAGRDQAVRQGRLFALWFGLPCAGLFLLATTVTPLWTARYFLPLAPVVYLLLAIGLERLIHLSRPAGAAVTAFVLATLAVRLAFYFVEPQREDWRATVAWANAIARPGDVVCLPETSAAAVWVFYDRSGVPTRELTTSILVAGGVEEFLAAALRQRPLHLGRTLLVTRRPPATEAFEAALTTRLAERGRLLGAFRTGPLTVRVMLPDSRKVHAAAASAAVSPFRVL